MFNRKILNFKNTLYKRNSVFTPNFSVFFLLKKLKKKKKKKLILSENHDIEYRFYFGLCYRFYLFLLMMHFISLSLLPLLPWSFKVTVFYCNNNCLCSIFYFILLYLFFIFARNFGEKTKEIYFAHINQIDFEIHTINLLLSETFQYRKILPK